jgi:hypothetical protein
MTDDIHSCSYYCTRPACVLAQRNEMRDAAPPAPSAEPVNLNDPVVQKRLAAQWGYVSALSAEPVAWLYQHGMTGRTRIVMPDQVFTNAPGQWLMVGPLYQHPPAPSAEPVAWIARYTDRAGNPRVFTHSEREVAEFGNGVAAEPLYISPPDHLAVMRQALEALEERYIGALRDNAIDALRAALEGER